MTAHHSLLCELQPYSEVCYNRLTYCTSAERHTWKYHQFWRRDITKRGSLERLLHFLHKSISASVLLKDLRKHARRTKMQSIWSHGECVILVQGSRSRPSGNQNQIFLFFDFSRDLASSGPQTYDWSHSLEPPWVPFSLWKYSFLVPRDGSISQNMCQRVLERWWLRGGGIIWSHCSTALQLLLFEFRKKNERKKKEGLMRTCKGISEERIVTPFYISICLLIFTSPCWVWRCYRPSRPLCI